MAGGAGIRETSRGVQAKRKKGVKGIKEGEDTSWGEKI